eukprot:3132857-Amphidinium_carterae.1
MAEGACGQTAMAKYEPGFGQKKAMQPSFSSFASLDGNSRLAKLATQDKCIEMIDFIFFKDDVAGNFHSEVTSEGGIFEMFMRVRVL